METRANYVLIGAFTLVASIALLLFGLWAAEVAALARAHLASAAMAVA